MSLAHGSNGDRRPCVYVMASAWHGTIYVGVTSDLVQRAWQHRTGGLAGFTRQYGCRNLVYFELHVDMPAAITREKQLKGGSRAKKIALIEAENPRWLDLYAEIL